MTRAIIAALLIAGTVPAFAQDDEPGPRPAHHRLAPPRAVRDLRVAAIQAPAPTPRPRPPATPGLTQTQAQQNPVAVLQKFTVDDLQAALADAQAQTPPDIIAANCYQALIVVVQSPAVNPFPAAPGAFQLFQKGRDIKNALAALQSNSGPLTQLNIACAPLIMDVQQTLIRLGLIGGAIAVGVP